MSAAKYRIAFRTIATGAEHHNGLSLGDLAHVQHICDEMNRRHVGVHFHWPEEITAAPPCPRCKGLGYITEDPAPECPGIGYEETECSACEGSGEAAPEALAAAREGSS